MRVQIYPRSLKNLEQICEVLYCLHPSVLDYMCGSLIDDIGCILGNNNLNNLTFEQREELTSYRVESEEEKQERLKILKEKNEERKRQTIKNLEEDIKKETDEKLKEELKEKLRIEIKLQEALNKIPEACEEEECEEEECEEEEFTNFKALVNYMHGDGEYPEDEFVFKRLLKYLQLDTDEYIPINIYVEVEDHSIGKKLRKLVRFLEKTNAPEQFYLHKREADSTAYFAEGYGLTMNEEQRKKEEDLYLNHDYKKLKKLLIKEKLYYY